MKISEENSKDALNNIRQEFDKFTLKSGDIVRLMNKQSESFLTISDREIKTLIEKKFFNKFIKIILK